MNKFIQRAFEVAADVFDAIDDEITESTVAGMLLVQLAICIFAGLVLLVIAAIVIFPYVGYVVAATAVIATLLVISNGIYKRYKHIVKQRLDSK